jgi:hypothetical protein
MLSVCVYEMFTKFDMHIMAPEPMSTAYFINSSNAARQRMGKNVTAATNTQATIENLFTD